MSPYVSLYLPISPQAQLHVVMENLSGGNLRQVTLGVGPNPNPNPNPNLTLTPTPTRRQRLMERGTYYDEATAARRMRPNPHPTMGTPSQSQPPAPTLHRTPPLD